MSLVDRDDEMRAALLDSDLNLPDGTPVAWLGRRQGANSPVRGPSLVGDVAALGVPLGLRHYLYGGKEGVAAAMADGLRQHFPGFESAGEETPPFRHITEGEIDQLASRVRVSGAHILWVGLGTPRQDHLVPRLAQRLSMPIVPVGAAFDFWSGAVTEAPKWLHGSGFEWVHRLMSEPKRLWRRYLIDSPRFLLSAVLDLMKRKVANRRP